MKYRYYLPALFSLLMITNIQSQEQHLLKVIVGNEGNFGSSNATITEYMYGSGIASDGVFLSQNGVGLGDVVQSINWYDSEYYIVVNNSSKIVVASESDYSQSGVITLPEGATPREMLIVSDDKAYVSDLFGNKLWIVNPKGRSVSENSIPAGANPDQIIEHNGFAYVSNNGYGADSTIFKIDIQNDMVVDTFVVSRGPAGMEIDDNGTLWVVCTGYSGDYDDNWNLIPGTSRPGGIHGINLADPETDPQFTELPSAGSDLILNSAQDMLYINTGGVRGYDLINFELAADTLIKGSFYAMDYDTLDRVFYLADAKDFSSAGSITLHGESSGEITTFHAGIIPGSFQFVYSNMVGTSSEEELSMSGFSLEQNYPNPFNPSTTISYSLSTSGFVTLDVYNVQGQRVATLVNGNQSAGTQSVRFDASGLASGIYLYRLSSPAGTVSKKMMLIK